MRLGSTIFLAAALAVTVGCNDRNGDEDAGPDDMMDGGGGGGDENTAALCSDGMDNDGDMHADCNDFDCCALVTCGVDTACGMQPDGGMGGMACDGPPEPEDNLAACSDGCSNDHDEDLFVDCRDNDCRPICGVEASNIACNDGEDNNDNDFTDCDDFSCQDFIVCAGEATNANCSDGEDNDGDGDADCDDEDCQDEAIVVCDGSTPIDVSPDMWASMVETRCTNGASDDADGRFDCGEFSCLWNYPDCVRPPTRENTNASCVDGEDNDQDGVTDCEDEDCQQEGLVVCDGTSPVSPAPDPADYESLSNAECENGINDDEPIEDGGPFVDCDDFSCSQNPDVTVCGEYTEAECTDGENNDAATEDGEFIDCDDRDCQNSPVATSCFDAVENTYEECTDGIDNDGNGFFDCGDFNCEDSTAACGSVGGDGG